MSMYRTVFICLTALTLALNTHCHADHITGSGELKRRVPGLRSAIAKAAGA